MNYCYKRYDYYYDFYHYDNYDYNILLLLLQPLTTATTVMDISLYVDGQSNRDSTSSDVMSGANN